jgi:hypothetical protein
MSITSSVIFCGGTYNVNYIHVHGTNFIIDCNNAILIGDGNSGAFEIDGLNYVTNHIDIRNCNLENYGYPITISGANSVNIENVTINKARQGISLPLTDDSSIINSRINTEVIGIVLSSADRNFIVGNVINNTHQAGFWKAITFELTYNPLKGLNDNRPVGNIIYNNTFYHTGIGCRSGEDWSYYSNYNIFCMNGIGNNYLDGATGPTCPSLSTQEHNHDERYYTKTETDNTVTELNNRITTVETSITGMLNRITQLENYVNMIICQLLPKGLVKGMTCPVY